MSVRPQGENGRGVARTIAGHGLLIVCLAVSEPVEPILRRICEFVIEVFPTRMRNCLDGCQRRSCVCQGLLAVYIVWHGAVPGIRRLCACSSDLPGQSPTTLPSSAPILYHERHFSLYTVFQSVMINARHHS